MGVYLSTPNTLKTSCDGKSDRLTYGASSMQGWRQTQEDAHNCILKYDDDPETAFFAVYDGHGGSEVAEYCSLHLPDHMKNMTEYRTCDLPTALQAAFMDFDKRLTKADVVDELKVLCGQDKIAGEEEAEKSEAALLVEEAVMPLEKVLLKYTDNDVEGKHKEEQSSQLSDESCSSTSACSSTGCPDKVTIPNNTVNGENITNNSVIKIGNECKVNHSKASGKPELANGSNNADVKNSINTLDSTNNSSSDNTNLDDISSNVSTEDHIANESNKDDIRNLAHVVDSTNGSNAHSDDSNINCSTEDCDMIPQASINETSEYNIDKSRIEEPINTSTPITLPDSAQEQGTSKNTTSDDITGEPSCSSTKPNSLLSSIFTDELDDDDSEDNSSDIDASSEDSGEKCADDEEMWEDCSEESEEEEEEDDDEILPYTPIPFHNFEQPGSDSGCTALVALLRASRLIVANAGDCRCVLARSGKAVELSVDHKPEDKLERKRIEAAGGKVTADGRVNGGLNLSRALGDHGYKDKKNIDLKDQMISAFPDVQSTTIVPEDAFFILACDGIWNVMSSQDAVNFVVKQIKDDPSLYLTPSRICEDMFDLCLAPDTNGDGTGCDNMTCIIVFLSKTPHLIQTLPNCDESHENVVQQSELDCSNDDTGPFVVHEVTNVDDVEIKTLPDNRLDNGDKMSINSLSAECEPVELTSTECNQVTSTSSECNHSELSTENTAHKRIAKATTSSPDDIKLKCAKID